MEKQKYNVFSDCFELFLKVLYTADINIKHIYWKKIKATCIFIDQSNTKKIFLKCMMDLIKIQIILVLKYYDIPLSVVDFEKQII